jgi:hypothetical protein
MNTVTLTARERQTYIESVVIPNFSPMLNQYICSTLFDVEGKVIICTTKNALDTGFDSWQETVGLSFLDVGHELITRTMKDVTTAYGDKIIATCHKIHQILKIAIEQRKVLNYIDLIPYSGHFKSYLNTLIPIFHPSGEVIAVQNLVVEFQMFEFSDFLNDHNQKTHIKSLQIPSKEPPLKLPARQHEILYLILQGIPQEYAAQILNIKRGTLARIISEQICPKFNIHGSNTKILIERAMQMGFQHFMPKSLWAPGIIILDPEIAQLVTDKIAV